jgi:hypothetical protein
LPGTGWILSHVDSGFHRETKCFTNVVNKEESIPWEQEQEESFDELRYILEASSFLMHADAKASFFLPTEASDVGIGAVLIQRRNGELRRIQVASKSLSRTLRR